MERDELIKSITEKVDTVNKLFHELESDKTAKEFSVKQKTKIAAFSKSSIQGDLEVGDLSKMSDQTLEDYEDILKRTIKSKWMSVEGRKEIWEKKKATLKESGYDLSEDEFSVFIDVINSDEVQRLIELKVLDSFQAVEYSTEDTKSKGLIANIKQLTKTFGQKVHNIKGKTIMNILNAMKTAKQTKLVSYNEMNITLRELKRYSGVTKLSEQEATDLIIDITKVRRGEIGETDLMKSYK